MDDASTPLAAPALRSSVETGGTRDDDAAIFIRCQVQALLARGIAEQLSELFEEASSVAAYEDRGQWWVELQFLTSPDEEAVRATLRAVLGPQAAQAAQFGIVTSSDWVAKSLAGLAPVTAGRFTVHGAHDRSRVAPNRIAIEIEAALAFGTGHHATTRGCLRALDLWAKRRKSDHRRGGRLQETGRPGLPAVLDIGTGTGVLAIAAAKVLRARVLASDIDPLAVRIATENAVANRAAGGPPITVVTAAGLAAGTFQRHGPFGLIFANILLAPLKRLAAPLCQLAAPGATIILSGVLTNQAGSAVAAYRAQGAHLAAKIQDEEWTTLILRRIGNRKRSLTRFGRRRSP